MSKSDSANPSETMGEYKSHLKPSLYEKNISSAVLLHSIYEIFRKKLREITKNSFSFTLLPSYQYDGAVSPINDAPFHDFYCK